MDNNNMAKLAEANEALQDPFSVTDVILPTREELACKLLGLVPHKAVAQPYFCD